MIQIFRSFMHYIIFLFIMSCTNIQTENNEQESYTVYKIGEVIKEDNHTYIVIEKKYEEGLMGMENFSEITVLYWFDQNENPEKRAVLQVHPQGNKNNPMRGVFSTHSPARPNLIAISRCRILSVKDNIIEIDEIDAFNHSPVIDLKN